MIQFVTHIADAMSGKITSKEKLIVYLSLGNRVSMGQLKKFEIKIYGTNDVPEEQIDIPEVKRNQAEPNKEPTNNWPGVNPKLELPFPKYQYIGTLSRSGI